MNASFSFCNKSQEYFWLFLKPRGMRKVPERNLYCLLEIRVLKNLFPTCRSVTLKQLDTINSTANLSTCRHLTNQSMIPESGIMERRHQRHVFRLRCPFYLPRQPLSSLRSTIFSYLACDKSRLSALIAAGDVSRGGTYVCAATEIPY